MSRKIDERVNYHISAFLEYGQKVLGLEMVHQDKENQQHLFRSNFLKFSELDHKQLGDEMC
jgi:hypothetical protein